MYNLFADTATVLLNDVWYRFDDETFEKMKTFKVLFQSLSIIPSHREPEGQVQCHY